MVLRTRGESLGIVSLRDGGLVTQKAPVRGKGLRWGWEPRAGAGEQTPAD
jgi:hypothetical protein